jgi:hypothetical protein
MTLASVNSGRQARDKKYLFSTIGLLCFLQAPEIPWNTAGDTLWAQSCDFKQKHFTAKQVILILSLPLV